MSTGVMRLREMTIRYRATRLPDGEPLMVGRRIRNAAELAPTLIALLRDEPSEVFVILCLSTKCRVMAFHEVSRGTLDATLVYPRDVFKAAILASAASIVLAHNHPSGDATPSIDDLRLTDRLVAGGRILGIPIADHLIIGDGTWVSLRDRGHPLG